MTLDQLEMIEAIVKEGSFQAAAKKLFKSQPSLSNGVKKIEHLYGIEIFSRDKYRPELTEVGRRFFEEASATLASYRALHKTATELGAGIEPQIKISIDPIVASSRIQSVFATVIDKNCKTVIKLESGILFENSERLLSNEVDLAVGHLPLVDNQAIESIKLCTIELIPVIHKKALKSQKLDKQSLKNIPNIIVSTTSEENSEIPNTSELKWYVDGHARKQELILEGLGWGRLSSTQVQHQKDIIQLDDNLVDTLNLDIFIMRNKNVAHGPIAQDIWKSFAT